MRASYTNEEFDELCFDYGKLFATGLKTCYTHIAQELSLTKMYILVLRFMSNSLTKADLTD